MEGVGYAEDIVNKYGLTYQELLIIGARRVNSSFSLPFPLPRLSSAEK